MSPSFSAFNHVENLNKVQKEGRISKYVCFQSKYQIFRISYSSCLKSYTRQMSRLSSFRGPSTPTSSPVQQTKRRQNQGKSTPSSPSNQIESTCHRKVRTCLQEIRTVTETWEDLVLLDGLKSLKKLVNTRTDLGYELEFFRILRVNYLLSLVSGLATH